MLVDINPSLNKTQVLPILPKMASQGEMVFCLETMSLMIFINGAWVSCHGQGPKKENFSIYLPALPNHTCAIFKTVLQDDLVFDTSAVSLRSDTDFVKVQLLVNSTKVQGTAQTKKGDCLEIMFEHDPRQSPSDLIISFSGVGY
jgi:hypothetical protein